jgi:hypothetical protein
MPMRNDNTSLRARPRGLVLEVPSGLYNQVSQKTRFLDRITRLGTAIAKAT